MRFEPVTSEYKAEALLLKPTCLVTIMEERNNNRLKKTFNSERAVRSSVTTVLNKGCHYNNS
jgi:hypothetical protein